MVCGASFGLRLCGVVETRETHERALDLSPGSRSFPRAMQPAAYGR